MTETGVDRDFAGQMHGKRLTTTEVLYYMPKHPVLLQSFMWQTLDLAPDFPRVQAFLEFWRRDIDAVIHSVSISCVGMISPAKMRIASHLGELH